MNPEISKLFDEIEQLKDDLEYYSKHEHEEMYSLQNYRKYHIAIRYEFIKKISTTLNPQIPQKYASMSRDEILGGIGQYARF